MCQLLVESQLMGPLSEMGRVISWNQCGSPLITPKVKVGFLANCENNGTVQETFWFPWIFSVFSPFQQYFPTIFTASCISGRPKQKKLFY